MTDPSSQRALDALNRALQIFENETGEKPVSIQCGKRLHGMLYAAYGEAMKCNGDFNLCGVRICLAWGVQ